jgi:hypothetical protein
MNIQQPLACNHCCPEKVIKAFSSLILPHPNPSPPGEGLEYSPVLASFNFQKFSPDNNGL